MFRQLISLVLKGRLRKNEKEWEFTTHMTLRMACCWKPLYTQILIRICGAWTSFSSCMLEKRELKKGPRKWDGKKLNTKFGEYGSPTPGVFKARYALFLTKQNPNPPKKNGPEAWISKPPTLWHHMKVESVLVVQVYWTRLWNHLVTFRCGES